MEYIYFNQNKQAFLQPITDYLCKESKQKWEIFKYLTLGKDYDVTSDGIVDFRTTPEYIAEELSIAKIQKLAENTQKAKLAVENGFVTFKNAQFETNAQTVGDLTATMLLLQTGEIESYTWLSKDDKAVELSLEDFINLGNLIAAYKNNIWSEKYIAFKTAIENAETLEELEEIEINYDKINL